MTDEQLALLWQAEFPNSRTRYTMKSVRTVRNLFNLGRRNNDRPRTPIPQYDCSTTPLGIQCWTCRTSDSMDGYASRDHRPVGSDTIHASIAHGNGYADAVLTTFVQEPGASLTMPGVRTELYGRRIRAARQRTPRTRRSSWPDAYGGRALHRAPHAD